MDAPWIYGTVSRKPDALAIQLPSSSHDGSRLYTVGGGIKDNG